MIAYDSVTAADIPADAQYVIGWADLRYAWSLADWQRFRSPLVLQSLVGDPAHDGTWLDVEATLGHASDCAEWVVRQRRSAFWQGGIYTFEDDDGQGHGWPPVKAALAAAGVTGVRFWIASELGELSAEPPTIPQEWVDQGVVLWQYAQSPGISPGHYDLSSIDPAYLASLAPPPAPDPQGAPMITFGTTKSAAGTDLPTIFYAAAADRKPCAMVQTQTPTEQFPFGQWDWFAMDAPIVTVNGADTVPAIASG